MKGNHDQENFEEYIVHSPFFICHGHTFNIYKSFDEVVSLAKKNHCSIIIHGHTHICFDDTYQGIRIINPGSAMMNRGCYGYGTYALMDLDTLNLRFYHHETHQDVTDVVLEDGKKTFQEFKNLIAEFNL